MEARPNRWLVPRGALAGTLFAVVAAACAGCGMGSGVAEGPDVETEAQAISDCLQRDVAAPGNTITAPRPTPGQPYMPDVSMAYDAAVELNGGGLAVISRFPEESQAKELETFLVTDPARAKSFYGGRMMILQSSGLNASDGRSVVAISSPVPTESINPVVACAFPKRA